jgi:hypothetical protein
MSGQCPIGAVYASRLCQANFLKLLVPDEGIEPPTFGLQNRCSTAELIRRVARVAGFALPASRAARKSGTL